ncbi:unnamed protein product [Amoebophrya sp. A25]|nr:unnamed protein product [Amoebophrya sp. A25]|eukprot:GSA25T00012455001.1
MIAGMTLITNSLRRAKRFLRGCYDPSSGRLSKSHILEARSIALQEMEANNTADPGSWPLYSVESGNVSSRHVRGAAYHDHGRRLIGPLPARKNTTAPADGGGPYCVNVSSSVVAFVDDQSITLKLFYEDIINGNLALVLDALKLLIVFMYTSARQFIAESKFEGLVKQNTGCGVVVNPDQVQKVYDTIRNALTPFGLRIKLRDTLSVLGYPLSATLSLGDSLWKLAQQRLSFAQVKVNRVLASTGWEISGKGLRLLLLWAFVTPIVDLVSAAVAVWDDVRWAKFNYDFATAAAEAIGLRPNQIAALRRLNAFHKSQLHRVVCSSSFLAIVEPYLLGIKCARTAATKFIASTGCAELLDYALIQPRQSQRIQGEEGRSFFEDMDRADYTLRQAIEDARAEPLRDTEFAHPQPYLRSRPFHRGDVHRCGLAATGVPFPKVQNIPGRHVGAFGYWKPSIAVLANECGAVAYSVADGTRCVVTEVEDAHARVSTSDEKNDEDRSAYAVAVILQKLALTSRTSPREEQECGR